MNTEHTPGPWTLGNENNSYAEVCIGNTDMTASMCRESTYTGKMVMSREEMLANAYLIIAAPDLLEALEDSESDLACYEGDPKYPAKNATLKVVRAAIAKARGKEGN